MFCASIKPKPTITIYIYSVFFDKCVSLKQITSLFNTSIICLLRLLLVVVHPLTFTAAKLSRDKFALGQVS